MCIRDRDGDAPSALAVSRYDDETAQMMVNIFQKLMQAVGDLSLIHIYKASPWRNALRICIIEVNGLPEAPGDVVFGLLQ